MQVTISQQQEIEDWEQITAILELSRQHWEQIKVVLNDPEHSFLIQERLDDHAYGMAIAYRRRRYLPGGSDAHEKIIPED